MNLEPEKADGLRLRVVQMRRSDSDHRPWTWFITTASVARLSTQAVADAYLNRWPAQEDLFRRARHGTGLERSHGYGVAQVTHAAILGKRETAAGQQQRAEQALEQAEQAERKADTQLKAARERLKARTQAHPGTLNGRHKLGVRQARQRLKACQQAYRKAKKTKAKADPAYQQLQTVPAPIYVRDTALDAITTCLKMTLLALLEFICQEYLGHYRLLPQTFIEAWLPLPVTIRQYPHCVIYEVAPNPRDLPMTQRLEQAFQRITAKKLHRDGRLLVVRLRDGP